MEARLDSAVDRVDSSRPISDQLAELGLADDDSEGCVRARRATTTSPPPNRQSSPHSRFNEFNNELSKGVALQWPELVAQLCNRVDAPFANGKRDTTGHAAVEVRMLPLCVPAWVRPSRLAGSTRFALPTYVPVRRCPPFALTSAAASQELNFWKKLDAKILEATTEFSSLYVQVILAVLKQRKAVLIHTVDKFSDSFKKARETTQDILVSFMKGLPVEEIFNQTSLEGLKNLVHDLFGKINMRIRNARYYKLERVIEFVSSLDQAISLQMVSNAPPPNALAWLNRPQPGARSCPAHYPHDVTPLPPRRARRRAS